jgi:hypothetical protein
MVLHEATDATVLHTRQQPGDVAVERPLTVMIGEEPERCPDGVPGLERTGHVAAGV